MSRWNVVGIFVCLLVLAPMGQARQQATSVVIGGTVTDIGGGVIPGATVALETKDAQPKVLATQITNSEGKFRFENVQPGAYQVRTSLQGFKTAITPVLTVAGTDVTALRITLEVGALVEVVTVTSASAGGNLTFLPGVSARSSTINGLPSNTINITIDGVQNSNLANSTDGFYSQVRPRQDAVEAVTFATHGEAYAPIVSNPFLRTADHPLSTFA